MGSAQDWIYLTDFSPTDQRFEQKKALADKVARLYSLGNASNPGFASGKRLISFDRYTTRIQLCGNWLLFGEFEDGSKKLLSANFCRVPSCPMCMWRRSAQWRAKFFAQMPNITADYPTHRWVFLTLTVKNCLIGELRENLRAMGKAWTRLSQLVDFPLAGCVKSVEVTRAWDWYDNGTFLGRHGVKWWNGKRAIYKKTKKGTDPEKWQAKPTDEVHPHYHILGLVPAGYFSKNYVTQAEWTQMWKQSLRIQYDPVVHIKTVKTKTNSVPLVDDDGNVKDDSGMFIGVCETLKYTVKEQDLIGGLCEDEDINSEWLKAITEELYLLRRVEYLGVLKQYGKDIEVEEDSNENLIKAGVKKEDNGELIKEYVYRWNKAINKYVRDINL